jgi:hypothetical protein
MWYFAAGLLVFTTWFGSKDMFHESNMQKTHITQQEIKIDQSKIRYGDYSTFKKGDKVGTVRSTEIYEAIPAYKTIRKEAVAEGSARWQQLMREATESYKNALKTASSAGYILIIEENGISGYEATDITQNVIQAI